MYALLHVDALHILIVFYSFDTGQWLLDNADLNLLIVSGDNDAVVGTFGTQMWMWDMGWYVTWKCLGIEGFVPFNSMYSTQSEL